MHRATQIEADSQRPKLCSVLTGAVHSARKLLKASPFRTPAKAMKAFLLLALATVASALTPAQIDVLAALGRGKLQELNRRLPPS